MTTIGKAVFGVSLAVSVSSSVAISSVKTNNWYRDNPEAKKWITDNKYSRKADKNLVSFVHNSNEGNFGLGCHKLIFGDKGFKQLYKDTNIDNQNAPHTRNGSYKHLKNSDPFSNHNEPVLGCSTSHLKNPNVYEFELALRQGDKGLVERVSVHTNKIISQLVFYEKDRNTNQYKHLFGLYKYIKQNHKDSSNKAIYKWANPQSDSGEPWSDLAVVETAQNTSRYYAVWIEGNSGLNMFDSLGVKSKGKIFSSLIDEEHEGSSDFIYVPAQSNGELNQTLISSPTEPQRYKLSSLYYLRKQVHSRKGKWKQLTTLCLSAELMIKDRLNIKSLKQLSKYCYEPQTVKPRSE